MKVKSLVLSLIFLIVTLQLSAEEKRKINSWQELFTEPCEIIYFIMKDSQPFRVSSGGVTNTHVPIEELSKRLKNEEEGYEIKDIAIVIHNHHTGRRFSPADWTFYRDLKHRGFNGRFLMYCHKTKEVYNIEDGNKEG